MPAELIGFFRYKVILNRYPEKGMLTIITNEQISYTADNLHYHVAFLQHNIC